MAKTKKAAANKTVLKPAAIKKTSRAKTASTSPKRSAAKSADPEAVVSVDRRADRDRRKTTDRRAKGEPVVVERRNIQRREKVNRRRQIDPTTCERDYSDDEIEFMNALDEYKRLSGRMFPTCSEVLEVLKKLGYEKRPQPVAVDPPVTVDQPARVDQPFAVDQPSAVDQPAAGQLL